MTHFPLPQSTQRAPRVKLNGSVFAAVRVEGSGSVRAKLYEVSATGGMLMLLKPLQTGDFVEIAFQTSNGAVQARKKAGLPEDLVLYCARHDFGTYVLQKTGNIAAVMNSMGHSDVKTAMTYQHPELNVVRDAINSRHILRHTAETVN